MAPNLRRTMSNASSLIRTGPAVQQLQQVDPIWTPGGPTEIVFSFDTTGSMYECLTEVTNNVKKMIGRLFKDMPNLRIPVIAHGDYDTRPYVTKIQDFTSDVKRLCDFIENAEPTGGSTFPECYELVLREVSTKLSWTPGTQRSLVLIGDAEPQKDDFPCRGHEYIDWEKEAECLFKERNVHVYAVHCLSRGTAWFYRQLSQMTMGKYIKMSQFSNVFDMLMAICYREQGPDMLQAYEAEVRARGNINQEMNNAFTTFAIASQNTNHTSVTGAPSTGRPLSVTSTARGRMHNLSSMRPNMSVATSHKRLRKSKRLKEKQAKACVTKRKPGVLKTNGRSLFHLKRVNSYDKREITKLNLKWSSWRVAMTANVTPGSEDFFQGRECGLGYKAIELYSNVERSTNKACVVYEFAVRIPGRDSLYVTFANIRKSTTCRYRNWEKALLGRKHIASQIDEVLKNGCTVYYRRAVQRYFVNIDPRDPNKYRDVKKILYAANDYAWCKGICGRKNHKKIVRHGVVISNNEI